MSMLLQHALMSSSGAVAKTYVDDVFSAYTYTGNGSAQTIINGIDLAGKGGLVWTKSRSSAYSNILFDTARGNTAYFYTNDTSGGWSESGSIGMTSFNSNGYTVGSDGFLNSAGDSLVSWTFRKAPKFFDIVTYTGNGANRTIAHNLGVVPGLIIVKRTDVGGNWKVYHRGLTSADYILHLNLTDAQTSQPTAWNSTAPTSTDFSIGTHVDVNTNTGTYVAYLFAHDSATDGMIQCGSYTGNGSATGPTVSLGWEPQFLIIKNATTTAGLGWHITDTSRGLTVAGGSSEFGLVNSATALAGEIYSILGINATGFSINNASVRVNESGSTYIYLAIRRPNKPPTTGTQVYNAIARTGTGAAATVTGVGFAPDLISIAARDIVRGNVFYDRLRGGAFIRTYDTAAELVADSFHVTNIGISDISLGANPDVNGSGTTYINHFFKRAPGVLSQICYSGTGANKTESHDLGVAPELWLVKGRSGATQWVWGSSLLANTEKIVMPTPAGKVTDATAWNSTYPSSTVLSLGTASAVNTSSATYTAYLWATKAGVSKVFSYTGNGSSQNIDCGFTTGARFILIVRTSAAGSVYIWDTTRGVVAGNDPYLALDTTAAEVTTDDSVDPLSAGFIVNQVAASNVNVNGATYLGLAYA